MRENRFEYSGPIVSVIEATPFLTAEHMETISHGAKAIVIITFANGGIPERLASFIQSKVASEIPVFLLSSNFGTDHGIVQMWDQSHIIARDAGATFLEKVNVNSQAEVLTAIQEAIAQGNEGGELASVIEKRYKYSEGEKRPAPPWEQ